MNPPLNTFARDVTSQEGEDGILERIFTIIPPLNKWCLECGALDGKHDSNTWNLITEKGWHSLQIEAEPTYFERLVARHRENPKVICYNEFLTAHGPTSLECLCERAGMPKDFDLLVLDIDGNDYHIWDSLNVYRPRIVVIEFNQSIPNSVSFVQESNPHVFQGSSLRAIVELGKKKGYELIATTTSNAFFCEKSLYRHFDIADNSLDTLHTDTTFHTRIFQLYDGTLKIDGYKKLIWKNVPLNEELLQVIPKNRRRYSAHIDPNKTLRFVKHKLRTLPGYHIAQRVRKSLWK